MLVRPVAGVGLTVMSGVIIKDDDLTRFDAQALLGEPEDGRGIRRPVARREVPSRLSSMSLGWPARSLGN